MKKFSYQVVHIKHDVTTIQAKSSYESARTYADWYGLKNTEGIDVHLIAEVFASEKLNELEKILEEV